MGGMHAELAMKVEGITGTEKLVLCALGTYANPEHDDCCWPSMKKLADRACLSASTVRAALRRLEDRGLIRTREQQRERDGGDFVNEYWLDVRAMAAAGSDRAKFYPATPHREPVGGVQQPVGGTPGAGGAPHREPVGMNKEAESVSESGSALPGLEAPKPRAKRRMEVPLPADFSLTPAMENYSRARAPERPDVADLFEEFTIHHRKHDSRFADWEAAWQGWVRNAHKFAVKDGITPPKRPRPDDGFDVPDDGLRAPTYADLWENAS